MLFFTPGSWIHFSYSTLETLIDCSIWFWWVQRHRTWDDCAFSFCMLQISSNRIFCFTAWYLHLLWCERNAWFLKNQHIPNFPSFQMVAEENQRCPVYHLWHVHHVWAVPAMCWGSVYWTFPGRGLGGVRTTAPKFKTVFTVVEL